MKVLGKPSLLAGLSSEIMIVYYNEVGQQGCVLCRASFLCMGAHVGYGKCSIFQVCGLKRMC